MFRVSLLASLLVPGLLSAQEKKPAPAEAPKAALQKLTTYPAAIELVGPRDEQRVGIVGEYADGSTGALSRAAKVTSANSKIAEIDAGIVRPVGDGATTITIEAAGKSQTIPVKVTNATADIPVSFSREIVPILTRAGCNGGACH